METVSLKWKYIGANTIKEPLIRNNNWLKYEFSIIKNWVSSLPKWYEATIKKIINDRGLLIEKIPKTIIRHPATNPSIPSMKLIKFMIAVNIKVIKIKKKQLRYNFSKLFPINKLLERRILDEVNIWKEYLKKGDTL